MLDECDYDKRLGANERTDFGCKPTEIPLESSESSSKFLALKDRNKPK